MTFRTIGIKRVSYTDVIKIPRFKEMTQEQFISKETDEELRPFLHELGINLNREVEYQFNKHRNLDGEAVMDFSVTGYERTDIGWLNSKYASIEARINSQKDDELRSDMIRASQEGIGDRDLQEFARKTFSNAARRKSSNPEWEKDMTQTEQLINAMTRVIKDIRGIGEGDVVCEHI